MKSPFPGMDPYLEKYWQEVHQSLIIYTRDRLQPELPPTLHARAEQRVFLEQESDMYRVIRPDVHIVEHPEPWPAAATAAESAVATEEEPIFVVSQDEPMTESYIEIVDAASGNRVVTVIEFVSPTNKVPGEGQDKYVQKQRDVIAAGANLVEIDLTRSGRRALALANHRIPTSHRSTYQVCVRRGHPRSGFEIYRVPLLRRLPAIRIPLRPTDADLRLELQPLVDLCYANGRYDDLDYRSDPNPPLEADEAAQADELLRGKGLR